ncbi:MAG: hypothetical protein FGM58_05485 [Acidimicrobiia bacterium]|nr:hypothetical protein [Acidimicrobiia bacterium]
MGMRAVEPETCLVRTGLEWSTDRAVKVGGIEFRPVAPGARVVFDPFNARVGAVGYEAYGSVLGAPVLIDQGVIDWSFQYTPSQNGPVGNYMPTRSDTVNLATVGRLPGLADVATFPKQPVTGFADYTLVTDESVLQLAGRFPSLATSEVEFPLDAIGLREIPRYTISVPSGVVQKVLGLDITGSFTIQPVSRGGSIGLVIGTALALPEWLSGFTARFAAFFPVNGSTQVDEGLIDIKEIDLKLVQFRDIYMSYDKATDSWAGSVSVRLGEESDDALGFDGRLSIVNGKLQSVGVAVTGLPIQIGTVASINRLGGLLTIEPLGIRANAQIGIGPLITVRSPALVGLGIVPQVEGQAAFVDGEITLDVQEVSITGNLTIAKVKVGDYELKGLQVGGARIAYFWDGLFSVSGNAKFFFDKEETWGIRGGLRGGITADALSLGGDVSIGLGPLLKLGGTAAVSTRGWITCAVVKGLWFEDSRVGLSYDWGAATARIRGTDCNSDEYQVPLVPKDYVATPGRNASGDGDSSQTVEVVADQKMVTFAIDGSGDAATITGPDGTSITVTGREQGTQSDPDDPRWMVVHQPGDTVSYVMYARPAAGTWTVATSGAVAPKVTASVVSAKSRPLSAPTEALRPTSEPRPLSSAAGTEDVGSGVGGGDWSRIGAVLVLLGLALVVMVLVERRHG